MGNRHAGTIRPHLGRKRRYRSDSRCLDLLAPPQNLTAMPVREVRNVDGRAVVTDVPCWN
jgi:hypothetical protein